MLATVGGRKALVAVLILVTGVAVALTKGDVPPHLLNLLEMLFAGFVTGNSVEYVARVIEGRQKLAAAPPATPTQPPVVEMDLGPLNAQLGELRDGIVQVGAGVQAQNIALQQILDLYKSN